MKTTLWRREREPQENGAGTVCVCGNHKSRPADEVNMELLQVRGGRSASAMATAGKNTLEQLLESSLNTGKKSESESVKVLEAHQSLWSLNALPPDW